VVESGAYLTLQESLMGSRDSTILPQTDTSGFLRTAMAPHATTNDENNSRTGILPVALRLFSWERTDGL